MSLPSTQLLENSERALSTLTHVPTSLLRCTDAVSHGAKAELAAGESNPPGKAKGKEAEHDNDRHSHALG